MMLFVCRFTNVQFNYIHYSPRLSKLDPRSQSPNVVYARSRESNTDKDSRRHAFFSDFFVNLSIVICSTFLCRNATKGRKAFILREGSSHLGSARVRLSAVRAY